MKKKKKNKNDKRLPSQVITLIDSYSCVRRQDCKRSWVYFQIQWQRVPRLTSIVCYELGSGKWQHMCHIFAIPAIEEEIEISIRLPPKYAKGHCVATWGKYKVHRKLQIYIISSPIITAVCWTFTCFCLFFIVMQSLISFYGRSPTEMNINHLFSWQVSFGLYWYLNSSWKSMSRL